MKKEFVGKEFKESTEENWWKLKKKEPFPDWVVKR